MTIMGQVNDIPSAIGTPMNSFGFPKPRWISVMVFLRDIVMSSGSWRRALMKVGRNLNVNRPWGMNLKAVYGKMGIWQH